MSGMSRHLLERENCQSEMVFVLSMQKKAIASPFVVVKLDVRCRICAAKFRLQSVDEPTGDRPAAGFHTPPAGGFLHLAHSRCRLFLLFGPLMMPAGLIKFFFTREDAFSKIMCLYLRESELKELDYE